MSPKTSEQAMAAHVVEWLRTEGWDVYQEVTFRGPRADIVAKRGPVLHVIECKTSMSIALIEQGLGWQAYAHHVSIACPQRKGGGGSAIARRFGLGIIEVNGHGRVMQHVHPAFARVRIDKLAKVLREEHKTFAPAGNAASRFYSPWQGTCDDVARFVAKHPGATLREMLAQVSTHYASAASARSSLTKWIEAGKVRGVRMERDGKALRLYPNEAA